MNNLKDTGFQDLDGLNSNNFSSGRLVDLDSSPNTSNIKLDPTKELHQLEAIRQKRDIFDRNHFKAINQGHKTDVNEDDCQVSNQRYKISEQSVIRSDPMGSLNSLSQHNPPKQQLHPQSQRQTQRSQKAIFPPQQSSKEDQIISGNSLSPMNQLLRGPNDKLLYYQELVSKQEKEEEEQRRLAEKTMVRRHTDGVINQQSLVHRTKSKEMKKDQGLNGTWQTKGFKIIRLVSRFIQQLKQKTERIKFRMLNFRIFQMINDASANFEYILIQRWIKQKPSLSLLLEYMFQDKAKSLLQTVELIYEMLSRYIIVIKPDSLFKIVWDIILLIFIIINIFYIPIFISFEIKPEGVFEWLFDLLPSWIFVAEILLNFNTAYYDKGLMHEDRRSIIKHYVKGNFFWDLIVIIPFLMSQLDIPFVRYTLLLRLTRISSLMQSIEEVLNLEESLQLIVELIKLVFFLLLTGHFCGCAWHFVGQQEYYTFNMGRTWMTEYEADIMTYDWFDRYIVALYWSVITTVTVGYGDIYPVTTAERIFVIIVTLIICGVFGYCISNIGNIFKQMADKKMEHKKIIRSIHTYMRKRGLSHNLQLKIKKYFEYFFYQEQEDEQKTQQALKNLSKHLRQEVLTDLYSSKLKHSRFLRENFSDQTIANLCQYVKEEKILPEQMIFNKGDKPEKLFIILQGGVEYFVDHQNEDENYMATETQLKRLVSGAVFGEREFITQEAYNYYARSVKFTQLLYINYEDFMKVLRENQEQFERFCMTRDNLLFNHSYKGFGQICEVCQWTHSFLLQASHSISERCPFVFLQPNKNKITNRITESKDNKRLKFPYRSNSKSNFRQTLGEWQETALYCIMQNNVFSENKISDENLRSWGFELNQDDNNTQKKNSFLKSQQITQDQYLSTQQPQLVPSIQTLEQKSQANTAVFVVHKDGSRQNNILNNSMDQKDSVFDWDNGSQIRSSVKKIKFQNNLDRGRTIQSVKSRHQGTDLDESMVQEENKIQSMNMGSTQFIFQKVKLKSKHTNGRKVSFLDFENQFGMHRQDQTSPPNPSLGQVDSDTRSAKRQMFQKDISKVSEASESVKEVRERTGTIANEIVLRMEARESSIVSKKHSQSNPKNEIVRRVKKRKTTNQQVLQLNCSIVSGIEPQLQESRSQKHKESSGVFTAGMNSHNNLGNDQDHNQSIQVMHSAQLISKRLLDIVHTHEELEIDRVFMTLIYYPDMNASQVINRLNRYYDELRSKQLEDELKEMKRTKTNLTLFDRIKNKTQIRGNFDKSFQE